VGLGEIAGDKKAGRNRRGKDFSLC